MGAGTEGLADKAKDSKRHRWTLAKSSRGEKSSAGNRVNNMVGAEGGGEGGTGNMGASPQS